MNVNNHIEWADSTWNPVTGCLNECEYCYARKIAKRFDGGCGENGIYELETPIRFVEGQTGNNEIIFGKSQPYPFGFEPTFHKYRLGEPEAWRKQRTIFVCSMADLFGDWVPDEWIEEVINACLAAQQHRYLFLTKNPARYIRLVDKGIMPVNQPNFWLGSTVTTPEMSFYWCRDINTFVSIEPILAPFKNLIDQGVEPASKIKWIIIGAETGRRKDRVIPQKAWIDEIVSAAKRAGTPVFMKESLRGIMGVDFRQEFPWEV